MLKTTRKKTKYLTPIYVIITLWSFLRPCTDNRHKIVQNPQTRTMRKLGQSNRPEYGKRQKQYSILNNMNKPKNLSLQNTLKLRPS